MGLHLQSKSTKESWKWFNCVRLIRTLDSHSLHLCAFIAQDCLHALPNNRGQDCRNYSMALNNTDDTKLKCRFVVNTVISLQGRQLFSDFAAQRFMDLQLDAHQLDQRALFQRLCAGEVGSCDPLASLVEGLCQLAFKFLKAGTSIWRDCTRKTFFSGLVPPEQAAAVPGTVLSPA